MTTLKFYVPNEEMKQSVILKTKLQKVKFTLCGGGPVFSPAEKYC